MKAWLRIGALALLPLALAGCKIAVFDAPVTVSTRALAVRHAEPIERVTIKKCNYQVLIVPIIRNPKHAYEELLQEAQGKGGNVVIDFEVRDAGFVGVMPFFLRACWEATGIAARM